ncbi:hypothetical protein CPB84DRAFT_1761905 [Gymnopilus junonius]|uniref:Uncharacterized protein n=1 Tax=Gymnopilus junonius TaxID=109634 RepID=A0A9P5P1C5_GYMJU|nr:hypothetical protein CPB84DRAFT_1761905 [Gymnopilus junonius]
MVIPLSHLPIELALEILRLACCAEGGHEDSQWPQSRAKIYKTASTLALVSPEVRRGVMPHLLHTVVLNSQASVTFFLRTVDQQRKLNSIGSRLKLDYTKYVRRIWSTECYQPFAEHPEMPLHDYRLLYDLFGKVQTLGFNFKSLHLLYEVIGGSQPDSLASWTYKRVTFAGTLPMWNYITSTSAGLSFLNHITHLTIWSTVYSVFGDTPSDAHTVPNWMRNVPFHLMPNLRHFAFSLIRAKGSTTTPVLVYTLPSTESPKIFLDWAVAPDPLKHGSLIHVNVVQPAGGVVSDSSWELAYYRGENGCWP